MSDKTKETILSIDMTEDGEEYFVILKFPKTKEPDHTIIKAESVLAALEGATEYINRLADVLELQDKNRVVN